MQKNNGAYYTGNYCNYFAKLGYDTIEISQRLNDIYNEMFYGNDDCRIYHETDNDMAYIVDTGNIDVRSEGMSYGMMVCVQLDRKMEFDRIWKWAKTYMYMNEVTNKGYFAWSCKLNGEKNAYGPAPDGEEYFAMALFFASARWGNGSGIFDYSTEAKNLLHDCIHKGENNDGSPMWDKSNHLIKFITECDFTDPSYHLPHFYQLFSILANPCDKKFWEDATSASREFLKKACHPKTGLSAEYSEYDGTPKILTTDIFNGRHDWYYSDAYRTIANIALDNCWFGAEEKWAEETACNLQNFFCETVQHNDRGIYLIDGTELEGSALHPVAMTAVNAQASLASQGKFAEQCVRRFWETPLRQGDRRYYDNFLYIFAFMALSGNYRIYM